MNYEQATKLLELIERHNELLEEQNEILNKLYGAIP